MFVFDNLETIKVHLYVCSHTTCVRLESQVIRGNCTGRYLIFSEKLHYFCLFLSMLTLMERSTLSYTYTIYDIGTKNHFKVTRLIAHVLDKVFVNLQLLENG